jgi:hypothetical protein
MKINSRAPFLANSENWRPWLHWCLVRGLVCLVWHECRACSHFLAILFEKIKIISMATSIRSFVIVHFCGLIFCLIALLKLCAAAALSAINADKGTYSSINEDNTIDYSYFISNSNWVSSLWNLVPSIIASAKSGEKVFLALSLYPWAFCGTKRPTFGR